MIFKPLPWMSLFTIAGLAVLAVLGTWQLNRLAWKTDLLAKLSAQMDVEPQAIDRLGLQSAGANCLDYRFTSVQVDGKFIGEPVYVYAVRESKPAHQIFRSLRQSTGETLIIDTGYVPYDQHNLALADPVSDKPTRITGIVRCPKSPGMFTPAPDLETRLWYVADLPDMALHLAPGVTPATGFYLQRVADAGSKGVWPRTRNPSTMLQQIPNNHLGYALTWFGLAAVLLVIYIVFHVNQDRLRFKK